VKIEEAHALTLSETQTEQSQGAASQGKLLAASTTSQGEQSTQSLSFFFLEFDGAVLALIKALLAIIF
jgi:hypothetical protein